MDGLKMKSSWVQTILLLLSLGVNQADSGRVLEGEAVPLFFLKSDDGGHTVTVFGNVREKLSGSEVIVYDLSLVNQSKKTRLKLVDTLTQEGGWYWPNHRLIFQNNHLMVIKVDPVLMPGKKMLEWIAYKQREIFFDGDQLVASPEKLVFKNPRLTDDQMKAIKTDYRRLKKMGAKADPKEIERLLTHTFLWALQGAEDGVTAFKEFKRTFSLDGAYAETEATYQEMYKQITSTK